MKEESIILGGGCFWCIEAALKRLNGVVSAVSGYCGDGKENANYDAVCSGKTLHAEVVKVTFEPEALSLETLLEVFFAMHDPTTLNRQGADAGTQYRSAIFYTIDSQKSVIEGVIANVQKKFTSPIVTEVTKAKPFYEAEAYHQNYYDINPHQGYCQFVIAPKIEKLNTTFKALLNP